MPIACAARPAGAARDSRRALVATIQDRLAQLNVGPLVADGAFGPRTVAAVIRFQGARGLAVDGVVGARTWAALFMLPDTSLTP